MLKVKKWIEATTPPDYSKRSCETCNLYKHNNGSKNKQCELELETKCASSTYNKDKSLGKGDYWIDNDE